MRDGIKLFTSVYMPKVTSKTYPFLIERTPYSVAPYGGESYPSSLGPSPKFAEEEYIFVYQDVRGRFMSEGQFTDMRPHIDRKRGPKDIDESSDTWDTVDWLVKNIPNNNGRAGMLGISYPGFYASAGMIDSHPALKAVSPQAPIADWFVGDDDHHNGALFLFDAFDFQPGFGPPRPRPTTKWPPGFNYPTQDAYKFFLELGPVKNANERYFHGNIPYWNDLMTHTNYDGYWRSKNLLPHLHNIHAAVLIVGGWFDAEDLYGTLKTYHSVERKNPGAKNTIVMGPWSHGGWSYGPGTSLGDIQFGVETGPYFRDEVEFPFFEFFLKDKGTYNLPEALVFETGANTWRKLPSWPPKNLKTRSFYLNPAARLSSTPPSAFTSKFDEYVSDPAKPVPFTSTIGINRGVKYMIEDQRFAARRPDVLSYQSAPLTSELAMAGPIAADLYVSTTGTDADFIVKVIDVLPDSTPNSGGVAMSAYQMLVRAEVMRGRFRTIYEKPLPFKPGHVTRLKFELRDICHQFKKGHRIMVQVQSTWFPLVDRNPQRFVNIYRANTSDFVKATHRIYHSSKYPSRIVVGIMDEGSAQK
jgi:putative CocE/NonD family hydrolase